jgi:signal peptidase I
MSGEGRKPGGRRRYLSYLAYLAPIAFILLAYGLIALTTQESNPFTIVTGTSMTPTIPPGSVAIISKVPFDQLQRGDVIVFVPFIVAANGGSCDTSAGSNLVQETFRPCFVIHRVYQIQDLNGQRIITTKGDNNPGPIDQYDTSINSSMYIGKVILIMPYVGYLTVAPYNEYAAAVLLVAIVVSSVPFKRKSSPPPAPEEAGGTSRQAPSSSPAPAGEGQVDGESSSS